MPDKKSPSEKIEDASWDVKAQPLQPTKKTKGKVILIIPSKRVVVEYGQGLGTEIQYVEAKHKSLKVGDSIEF